MIFWAALEYLPVLGPLIRIFMNGPPWRKNMLMGCCLIGISLPPHYYAHGNGGGGARSAQARKIAPASSPGNRSPESGVRSPECGVLRSSGLFHAKWPLVWPPLCSDCVCIGLLLFSKMFMQIRALHCHLHKRPQDGNPDPDQAYPVTPDPQPQPQTVTRTRFRVHH